MNFPRTRTLALMFAAVLSILVVISSCSTTPFVGLDQIPALDEGTTVRLSGLLVGLSINDGGSEDIILLDPSKQVTAKAICMPGSRPLPSRYVSIGDELRVTASTSGKGSSVVFTSSDDVDVSSESDAVLTVKILASNWALFEGDRFRISGVVMVGSAGGFLLADPDLEHSISLRPENGDANDYLGKSVVADASLRVDASTMTLYLAAASLEPQLPG